MLLGKEVGTVTATRKSDALSGFKFLLIQPTTDVGDVTHGELIVAVDSVGAGVGEEVILAVGRAARIAAGNEQLPVDATVIGIVDGMQMSA